MSDIPLSSGSPTPAGGAPAPSAAPAAKPRWQPLSAIDRRVAGVLVEKAKTTPESYPMTANAIVTACNQKSNRAPLMQLENDQVEEALERLRHMGAVGMVEGYGRVSKYRHYLYDWLGVDKVEMAVMAELLLRGPQTEGELRGRAARMEPIRDVAELRPVLDGLKQRGLVISLTPEGRGHVVSHALFKPQELEKVRAQVASAPVQVDPSREDADDRAPAAAPGAVSRPVAGGGRPGEVDELKAQVAQVRSDLEELTAVVGQLRDEVQHLRSELGG